ncbi:dual specificity tyrosine-phosphorylation-regulated kinase 2-like [Adelges cooleyi]|uniref:dual specificity tyrosine-phosphorylation-regulated kinase 2-like n=1 Tax=Adelges cooleyi TaxID=133065 RepID=UPI002180999E|nr:dual specificity tyrosine-phosphorylation-regulated kinase 2-like [Adelges cooleyi]
MSITVTTINPVATATIKEMPLSRNRPPHILLSNGGSNGTSSTSNDSCVSQSDDHLPSLLNYSQMLEKTSGSKSTVKKNGMSSKQHVMCGNGGSLEVFADKMSKPNNGCVDLLYMVDKNAGGVKDVHNNSIGKTTACLQPTLPPPNLVNGNKDDSAALVQSVIKKSPRLMNKPKKKGFTPDYVCSKYSGSLSKFEKMEIYSFPEIYFFGIEAEKKTGPVNGPHSIYDNDQGGYVFVQHDHVGYRYELLKVIGKGSFGQVVKAYDHKLNEYVALKIVRNEKRFYRQAQEEIRILEHLRKQDVNNLMNIIHMFDSFTFRKHMCITFELLSINLYELIKKNKYQGFSLQLVRKFSHSLLICLDALYRNKIIHCDMKPENVLLKQHGRSGIKVIDFGSSCFENQRVYTYIQSRFYRAPEVILGAKYGLPIDMWSLGCILVELLTGFPLFPGEDETDQLACIIELLGMPPKKLLDASKRASYFISSRGYPRYCTQTTLPDGTTVLKGSVSRKGKPRGPPDSKYLSKALKGCDDPLFVDFISQCLEWDPDRRITPAMALRHGWLRRRLPRPPATEHQHQQHHYSQESTPTSLRVKLSESNLHHQTLTSLPMHSRNSQISTGKLPQITTSTCIM